MKKFMVILFILANFSLFAEEKPDELKKSFTDYFSSIQKQYNYTKSWDSKRKIYKVLFSEFAGLLKQNAAEIKTVGAYYFLGMATGYLDLSAHIAFLEEELYEGEWIKNSGLLLKDYSPQVQAKIQELFRAGKLEYYQLYVGHRQQAVEKMVNAGIGVIRHGIVLKTTQEQEKVLLSGYLNSYLVFISLNQFLDGKLKLEHFVDLLAKTMRPQVRQGH